MKKVCKMCADCDPKTCECPCHKMEECCKAKKYYHGYHGNGGGDMVYCLGIIGAAIYFISNSAGFWMGVLGFLKAIVWPVFMVLEAFKFFIG